MFDDLLCFVGLALVCFLSAQDWLSVFFDLGLVVWCLVLVLMDLIVSLVLLVGNDVLLALVFGWVLIWCVGFLVACLLVDFVCALTLVTELG